MLEVAEMTSRANAVSLHLEGLMLQNPKNIKTVREAHRKVAEKIPSRFDELESLLESKYPTALESLPTE